MVVCIAAPGALAQSLFTVAGVHVDASAASSTEAANIAIAQGRPRAWQILYRRLTRQQDWARQPALDDAALQRLSLGYTIANERRSTTRYVGDVTYLFNPDAVARVLRSANIAFTQAVAQRILVVPMAPSYTHGPWADALGDPKLRDPQLPFVLPSGDEASLAGLRFETAGWGDVAAAAGRAHASEVALVQADYAAGRFTVKIRRLGTSEAPTATSVDVAPADPNVPFAQNINANYAAAASAAIGAIADLWKSRTVVDFNLKGRLAPVDVRADSLPQWGAIETALSGIGTVTSVTVLAMDIGEEQISISYIGTPAQLQQAMTASGLTLTNDGGEWTLAQAGPAGGQ